MGVTWKIGHNNTWESIYVVVLFSLRIFCGFLTSSVLTFYINMAVSVKDRGKLNGITLVF